MPGPPVLTFEATPAGLVLLGRHDGMAASSAALPDGAYTSFRTYEGRRILRFDRHVDRLNETIALEGRAGAVDGSKARAATKVALDQASWPESRLRLTFAPPRLFVAIEPFRPLPPLAYERGVECVTVDVQRANPHAKDTRFIATAREVYRRLPPGIEEALLVEHGELLEGLSSNLFVVLGGVLRTEEARALPGVTRSLVLEVAEGIAPVERRAARRDELAAAGEAFITSVSRQVLPVVAVDGLAIGDGRPGPLTRKIIDGFAALVAREAEAL